jgi:hypothetical protein
MCIGVLVVVLLAIPPFAGAQSEEAQETQKLAILGTDIRDNIHDSFG